MATLTPLLLAMRTEFDQPSWTVYFKALGDVPAPLLEATVDAMLREPREFFPKVGELRARAERERRVLLLAHPHEACCECEDSKGWRTVLVEGVSRMQRCPCVARHQERLASLGLAAPLAQLAGESVSEGEQVYPTLEQLPANVRQQLVGVARQKVLR